MDYSLNYKQIFTARQAIADIERKVEICSMLYKLFHGYLGFANDEAVRWDLTKQDLDYMVEHAI